PSISTRSRIASIDLVKPSDIKLILNNLESNKPTTRFSTIKYTSRDEFRFAAATMARIVGATSTGHHFQSLLPRTCCTDLSFTRGGGPAMIATRIRTVRTWRMCRARREISSQESCADRTDDGAFRK